MKGVEEKAERILICYQLRRDDGSIRQGQEGIWEAHRPIRTGDAIVKLSFLLSSRT